MRTPRPKISERTNPSGTVSWCVDAGICNQKRLRRFFKTKSEATSYADKLSVARKNHGDAVFSLTEAQRLEAADAFKKLELVGFTLKEAVDYLIDHVRTASPRQFLGLPSD